MAAQRAEGCEHVSDRASALDAPKYVSASKLTQRRWLRFGGPPHLGDPRSQDARTLDEIHTRIEGEIAAVHTWPAVQSGLDLRLGPAQARKRPIRSKRMIWMELRTARPGVAAAKRECSGCVKSGGSPQLARLFAHLTYRWANPRGSGARGPPICMREEGEKPCRGRGHPSLPSRARQ